jgi:hypothetical protein
MKLPPCIEYTNKGSPRSSHLTSVRWYWKPSRAFVVGLHVENLDIEIWGVFMVS